MLLTCPRGELPNIRAFTRGLDLDIDAAIAGFTLLRHRILLS